VRVKVEGGGPMGQLKLEEKVPLAEDKKHGRSDGLHSRFERFPSQVVEFRR